MSSSYKLSSSFTPSIASSGGGGGGGGAFDDLTKEEKLSLLKSEFDQLTSECLDDVWKSFGHDYETTRTVIQELFPTTTQGGSTTNHSNGPTSSANGSMDEFISDQGSLLSGNDLLLEITPDFFARLHSQVSSDGSVGMDYESLPLITKDFETQGSLLLPLDHSVATAIYKNIVQFVRRSNNALTEPEDEGLDLFECSQNPTLQSSLQSLAGPNESSSLKEIMELEMALKASREDYMEELSKMAKFGTNDEAISQELCLEKKRCFLNDKFPGVNELHLNNLFEINCYNLNETIKDIEAIYNFKLPGCYQHSLFCEVVKRENSDSGVASESTMSDDDDGDYGDDDGDGGVIRNDRDFTTKIQTLIEERKMCHIRIAHLRHKSAHFNFRKQPHSSMLYQQQIARCNLQMKQVSDNIVQTYVSYSYPGNSVDLHGLIMKEVHSIVPEILRRRQASLVQSGLKRIKLKIITGIGSNTNGNGLIRNYLLKYTQKKNLRFQSDGPGAFVLTLSSRNMIDF